MNLDILKICIYSHTLSLCSMNEKLVESLKIQFIISSKYSERIKYHLNTEQYNMKVYEFINVEQTIKSF